MSFTSGVCRIHGNAKDTAGTCWQCELDKVRMAPMTVVVTKSYTCPCCRGTGKLRDPAPGEMVDI